MLYRTSIRLSALKRTFQPSPLGFWPANYSSKNRFFLDHMKSRLKSKHIQPSADGWRNSEMGGYSTGSRAAADLAQPAPWSPSDRRSGPSGRSSPSVRSPAVLLGGAPDHQCRYPARVVPAGWRFFIYIYTAAEFDLFCSSSAWPDRVISLRKKFSENGRRRQS